MDKKTLYRLFYLPKLIEQKRREIRRIEERLGLKSPSLTGMPHGSGVHDKLGEGVPDLVDKKNELEEMVRKYEREEDALNHWIDNIEDPQIQIYISLRFKERMSWNEVADEAGGRNSENSVRMMVNRYLERSKGNDTGRDAE